MNRPESNIESSEKAVLSDALLASSGSTPTVNPDCECWVKDRIMTSIRMAASVLREAGVRADDAALQSALDGIANGTAVEIIRTLGMEPEFVNLRRPPSVLRGKSTVDSASLFESGDAETARKISESLPDLITSIRVLREHSKILRDAK